MSTIDYLYSQTNSDANGAERNVFIFLNTKTATIELGKVTIAQPNGDNTFTLAYPNREGLVVMGNIHGHPDSKFSRSDMVSSRGPGDSSSDRALASSKNIPVYSIEKNGNGRGNTNVYVNPPGGQNYYQYQGTMDSRSIMRDAIWQKIGR